jgi:hypothetical protein
MALTGIVLLAATVVSGYWASGLWLALIGMACLLLGAALLLPTVLRVLISGLEKLVPARKARLSWLLADSRWLLGPASLALMAMTLALVANSGLNTMINSFRVATDDWLSQRLAAELRLILETHEAKQLVAGDQVSPRRNAGRVQAGNRRRGCQAMFHPVIRTNGAFAAGAVNKGL